MWELLAGHKDSVDYLATRVFVADPKKIEQCLKSLNSLSFKDADLAMATLADYGRWVEGVLRKTLRERPPEEVRYRVLLLLERLEAKNTLPIQQERLRLRRVMEILEQAATPAAHNLLQQIARGATEEELRDEAQAASKRMSSRTP